MIFFSSLDKIVSVYFFIEWLLVTPVKAIFYFFRFPVWIIRAQLVNRFFNHGLESLFIACFMNFILGASIAYQLHLCAQGMPRVEDMIIFISSVSSIREMGSLISSIVFSSKIITSIVAETCIMRLTEQDAALKSVLISPLGYMLGASVFTGIIMGFINSIVCGFFGVMGGAAFLWYKNFFNFGDALTRIATNLPFLDWIVLGIKGSLIHFSILIIGVYYALKIEPTTKNIGDGVSQSASTACLVTFIVSILFAIVYITYFAPNLHLI